MSSCCCCPLVILRHSAKRALPLQIAPSRACDAMGAGLQEVNMAAVAERMMEMSQAHHEPRAHVFQCISAAASLGAKRIILADPAARRLRMRLTLNVPADAARQALQSSDGIPWMQTLNLC